MIINYEVTVIDVYEDENVYPFRSYVEAERFARVTLETDPEAVLIEVMNVYTRQSIVL